MLLADFKSQASNWEPSASSASWVWKTSIPPPLPVVLGTEPRAFKSDLILRPSFNFETGPWCLTRLPTLILNLAISLPQPSTLLWLQVYVFRPGLDPFKGEFPLWSHAGFADGEQPPAGASWPLTLQEQGIVSREPLSLPAGVTMCVDVF